MDIKLLLVKSISALYQASYLGSAVENTKDLVKQALVYTRMPDVNSETSVERGSIVQLRTTLLWMLAQSESQPYDRADLLQRLRVNVGTDDKLYDALNQGLPALENADKDEIGKVVGRFRRELKKYVSQERTKEVLKNASYQASFKGDGINDWQAFLNKIGEDLKSIDLDQETKHDPAYVATIDFDDPESVDRAYETLEELLSDEGVIKLPFKRANDLFGENQGMRRGEFLNWNALPGNYKSGWLLDTFVGGAIFNDPFLFDKTKIPAMVMFSTEDEAPIIMQKIFVILKQRETGLPVIVKKIPKEEIRAYVISQMQARGWKIFIHKVRPSLFTYTKYIQAMEEYKAKGFEIALCVCDYLSMFNKEGCRNDNKGDEFQDLFRRVREYCAINRITHPTAHQLSTDAKNLARQFPDEWLKMIPGKGYYEGCKKLETEVDFEGYLNKKETNTGTFLEVLWGKHRKIGSTPQKAKYFALRFCEEPMHGLMYDLDREDSGYDIAGGRSAAEGGGKHWFDLETAD